VLQFFCGSFPDGVIHVCNDVHIVSESFDHWCSDELVSIISIHCVPWFHSRGRLVLRMCILLGLFLSFACDVDGSVMRSSIVTPVSLL